MRDKFIQEVRSSGVLDEILAEHGCLGYAYYCSALEKDKILLVEKWKSEAKQQEHLKTAHMEAFKGIKEQYVLNTTVEKVKF